VYMIMLLLVEILSALRVTLNHFHMICDCTRNDMFDDCLLQNLKLHNVEESISRDGIFHFLRHINEYQNDCYIEPPILLIPVYIKISSIVGWSIYLPPAAAISLGFSCVVVSCFCGFLFVEEDMCYFLFYLYIPTSLEKTYH